MNITRKPYLQYMSNGQSLIQIYHCTPDTAHMLPNAVSAYVRSQLDALLDQSYFFCFQVPESSENPIGMYYGFDYSTPMKCLTAAESAFSEFFKLPKKGVWR